MTLPMDKMHWIYRAGMVLLLILVVKGWTQGRGHRLTSNQVIVSGRSHWQNWEFPQGTVEISPAGQVRSRRWRKNINAVADILEFLKLFPPASLKKEPEDIVLIDAVQAGSNRADVVKVLDDDKSTYWEPELAGEGDELASRAWFTVDLGRYVLAKKIALQFVGEGEGDPFLLFDVLVADGATPTRNLDKLVYRTVLRTLHPNKTQRVF